MSTSPNGSELLRKVSSHKHDSSFRIGKYALGERLGSGGFGIVRKGVNEETGEIVAIKVMDKTELKLHDMTQNVKKEITLLTTLHHPNIVGGLEVLNSKTKILLVMEYVDGGDMHTALSQQKRFPEEIAKKLFRSLMDCLAYCHEKGVYHRDLKLENLLLTTSGDLKVCDFGLASVRSMTVGKSDLCKTMVGTEDFSPPEILKNMPYMGDKADMWSAAVVLYVMLVGCCPFQGRSPRELAQKIVSCQYSFPRDFPMGPRRIINHLLVPDGKRRPSAAEILKDEWLCLESPRTIVENKLVSKMSSSSPWDTASEKAVSFNSKGLSFRSSYGLRRSEEKRSNTKQMSVIFNGSKKAAPIRDTNGHALYNALARANILNFFELFSAMRNRDSGIVVQDRKWRLRTYPNCFIGSEATSWIANHLSCSREEAIRVGQQFLNAGVFHHVVREHDFVDQYLFYRWHSDDPDNAWVANVRASYPRSPIVRPAQVVVFDLLNEFLALCKSNQQLHDFRELNTVQIQRDSQFQSFMISVGELQHATLPQGSNEEKLSFLVNLHNLLWLQARVHIGEFDEIDCDTLHRLVRKFEYAVQGIRVSLEDICISLYAGMESPSFEDEEEDRRRHRPSVASQKIGNQHIPLINILRRSTIDTEIELREALRPTFVDPLVLFLLSNGSPDSPPIRPVSEGIFAEKYLNMVAAEYLEDTLSIEKDSLTVRYPPKVDQFRQMARIFDDKEFINVLSDICDGSSVTKQLKGLFHQGRELGLTPNAVRTEQAEVDRLGVMFAPRIGRSIDISGSNESISDTSVES